MTKEDCRCVRWHELDHPMRMSTDPPQCNEVIYLMCTRSCWLIMHHGLQFYPWTRFSRLGKRVSLSSARGMLSSSGMLSMDMREHDRWIPETMAIEHTLVITLTMHLSAGTRITVVLWTCQYCSKLWKGGRRREGKILPGKRNQSEPIRV